MYQIVTDPLIHIACKGALRLPILVSIDPMVHCAPWLLWGSNRLLVAAQGGGRWRRKEQRRGLERKDVEPHQVQGRNKIKRREIRNLIDPLIFLIRGWRVVIEGKTTYQLTYSKIDPLKQEIVLSRLQHFQLDHEPMEVLNTLIKLACNLVDVNGRD